MDLERILLEYEAPIRLIAFAGILAAMAAWEAAAPRRSPGLTRRRRWPANLGLVAVDTIALRIVFPAAAVGAAAYAQQAGWGVLSGGPLPYWAAVVIGVVVLDFVIYIQHVLFHAVPALWRLHRVHHADLDFDVTTGLRFHPIEILLSMGIKYAAIFALGPPVAAVVIFEVLLNATSMFNHGNVRLPLGLDRVLRWVVVTPEMHRVHHSVETDETNSNFGFNLPWWDRLLGTYRAQPRAGHVGMTIGIQRLREPAVCAGLLGLLRLPFQGAADDYTINRRWGG